MNGATTELKLEELQSRVSKIEETVKALQEVLVGDMQGHSFMEEEKRMISIAMNRVWDIEPFPDVDNLLKRVPTQLVRWISPEEKLPKEGDVVLITDCDMVVMARYEYEIWSDGPQQLPKPKYWMYLPEPPKQ